jgi:hypothetical protein
MDCIEYQSQFVENPRILYRKFQRFGFKRRQVQDENGKNLYTLSRETCVFGDDNVLDAPPRIWGSNNPVRKWTPAPLRFA